MPFISPAYAQCPVCIVTVGGGMLIAKKLGVDDLLVSVWISALNTAIAFWLAPKLRYKIFKNPYILALILLITTLTYFQFTGQLSSTANQVLGLNKIILGQVSGLIIMIIGNFIYAFTKKKNGNKTLFPYARVVFPLISVIIITFFFKLIFKL
ncbi:hypothetical protein KKD37_02330 [Patescibacteria group bacterium]|nr:hypothetical protein [Patescibacteria group bacterium]